MLVWPLVLLGAFAGCGVESAPPPESPDAAPPPAAEAAPETSLPQSGSGVGAGADAGPLGLLGPMFPGLGGESHSAGCDPFEDSSEVCL